MPTPRVLILFNEPTLPPDHPDAESEHDILDTADTVAKILQHAGLRVGRLGVTHDPASVLAGITEAAPDVVFNLYEGTANWGVAEAYVAGMLELLRVPFTGCPTKPLLLCRSKPLTKQLLAGAGLPTAPFLVVDRGPVPLCHLPFPVIVKPALEDASVGIDQNSVVTSQAELEARVEYIRNTYGPGVLVEGFIRGREFNVAVIERDGVPTPLPFSEILFVPPAEAPDLWPIVSFDAKWRPGTRDFVATPAVNPAKVSPELHAELTDLTIRAYELAGCRDYARVDFRVDESGQPYVLEVNPNPCISPLAGLAAGLESAAIPYSEFILGLVRNALRRGSHPELAEYVGSSTTASVPAKSEPVATPARKPRWRIRPARRADLPAVAELLESVTVTTPEGRVRLHDRLAASVGRRRAGGRVLVLTANDQPIGVAWVRLMDEAEGLFALETIVVAPPSCRSGVGQALLAAAEREAAAAGGRILQADVSSVAGFAIARQFFARVGFLPIGETPDYYRDGSARLTFAKHLPAQVPVNVEPIPESEAARS